MGILGGGGSRAPPPVATAAAACSELRSAYDDCFNRWYADKFSKGQWHKEECTAEWNKYRSCLEHNLEDKHLRSILLQPPNYSTDSTTSHGNGNGNGNGNDPAATSADAAAAAAAAGASSKTD